MSNLKTLKVIILLILVLSSFVNICYAETIYILSDNNKTRLNIARTLKNELELSYKENIELINIDHNGDDKLRFTDIAITIGSKALIKATTKKISKTILAGYISKLSVDNIKIPKPVKLYSVFIEPPPIKQINLAKKHIPGDGSIGLLLGPYSISHIAQYKKAAKQSRVKLNIYISNKDNVVKKIKESVKNNIVITAFDPVTLNNKHANLLLYSAYLKRTPVIGFSKSFLKAGAAMSIYSTPRNSTDNILLMFDQIKNKSTIKNSQIYARKHTINYNSWVSYELDISTGDNTK